MSKYRRIHLSLLLFPSLLPPSDSSTPGLLPTPLPITGGLNPSASCPSIPSYRDESHWHLTSPADCQEKASNFSISSSIFTLLPRGRLGNHLHSYSLLVALQDRFPSRVFYMCSETFIYLKRYFTPSSLLLPSLTSLCMCRTSHNIPAATFPWELWNSPSNQDFIEDISTPSLDRGRAVILWPDRGYLYDQKQGVELMDAAEERIKKSLVFKKHFTEHARRKLEEVRNTWKKRNKKKVERMEVPDDAIVYVGIHHRRTDHLFFERAYSIPHLTKSYFIPAMDLYRKKFLSVIFVYVTDDPGAKWAKVNLRKDKDLVISRSMAKDPLVATGEDLALMSLCNHTIISRGTYSFWSSLLAGGMRLSPPMFAQSATDAEIESRKSISGQQWPINPLSKHFQGALSRFGGM